MGVHFYDDAVRMLHDMDAAESRVLNGHARPNGPVRGAAPPMLTSMMILPALPDFFSGFPEVSVEFVVSERYADLIQEGMDMALRVGKLDSSGLFAWKIGSMRFATVASPDYLALQGQIDVTDAQSIAAAAQRIKTEAGRLDLLVNNAAIGQSGRYSSAQDILAASKASVAPLDEMRALFETHVLGVLAVTQAMLPLIRLSATGRIPNVSSAAGSLTLNSDPAFPYRPYFGATYPASKTALNAITLALAIELEDTSIKVRAASPSFTATAINDFPGTDTVEVGARALVLAALDTESPTGSFTGPDGALPW